MKENCQKSMFDGFFASYAYLGLVVFIIFFLISLIMGIILSKIVEKKWVSAVVVIIGVIGFYVLDLDYSFLFLGIIGLFIMLAYLFKKKK